ncbi:hypothetical protein QJS66_19590 [Kocuria rhizophila]|nr:hypothetical protein QJS66_19590 [Kocuria rhizophila]
METHLPAPRAASWRTWPTDRRHRAGKPSTNPPTSRPGAGAPARLLRGRALRLIAQKPTSTQGPRRQRQHAEEDRWTAHPSPSRFYDELGSGLV